MLGSIREVIWRVLGGSFFGDVLRFVREVFGENLEAFWGLVMCQNTRYQ